ncbi:thioesterase family protein [Anaerofustis stercorihominis]|uniref:thioesterase family protein n=1 Tax=Anaerofustis stercorihominis TaxID=214853 RepID=UPI001106606F|nr:thioesterase family protein [Anaerofustis stercorihominis]
MNKELTVGLKNEREMVVKEEHLACSKGSGAAKVFSTPDLLLLMEGACFKLAEEYLNEGESTVGTLANFKHLAATPLGMKVRCECELIEIDRRRLIFKVEAYDEKEKVGEGIHERFIINKEKFEAKAESKK